MSKYFILKNKEMKKIFFSISFLLLLSFYASSQTVDAGEPLEICTDTVSMNASQAPVGYTGLWSISSGFCKILSPTSENSFVYDIIPDLTVLRWTISNDTNSYFDEITITNNTVTLASVNDNDEVCRFDYTLYGNVYSSGETGIWELVSGNGIIEQATNNNTNVTGLALDDNLFSWTITRGNCVSSDIITVSNNYIYADAQESDTICAETYTLNAQNTGYETAIWELVSSAGSPVIVSPMSNSTQVNNLAPNGNNFKWEVYKGGCSDYDIVIVTNNKPTVPDAGANKTACDQIYALNANNPVHGTGVWSVIGSPAIVDFPSDYNSSVRNLQHGANIFRWTITKEECSLFDETEIFYQYVFVDAGADTVLCNFSYQLQGNIPSDGSGVWSVLGGGASFVNASLHNTKINSILQGENTFSWTISYGNCTYSDNVIITNSSPSAANAGNNFEVCGSTAQFEANIPLIGNGIWTVIQGPGVVENPSLPNSYVSNLQEDENIFRWTIAQGKCQLFDEITVTNNIVSTYAGDDQAICGSETYLNADIPDNDEQGTWSVSSGSGVFYDSSFAKTLISGISYNTNSFKWTVKKGICTTYDIVTITNNLPDATCSVMGQTDICEDFAQISGSTPPSGASGHWTLMSGQGIFDNSIQQITYVRQLGVGDNIIRWTLEKLSCSDYAEITINRNSVYANAGDDIYVCEPSATINANEQAAGVTKHWALLSGGGNIAEPENNITQVTGLAPGINTFRWYVSGNGCQDEDDMLVINNQFFVSGGINKHICETFTVLNASNPSPGTGVWSVLEGTGVFSSPSAYQTTVSNISVNFDNIYRWTVTKNGCTAYDNVTIYNDLVVAYAGSDQDVCGTSAVLSANTYTEGTGTWTQLSGSGNILNPGSNVSDVTGLAIGNNVFRWTIENISCVSSDDVIISNNYVTLGAGADIETCDDFANLAGDLPAEGAYGIWSVVEGNAVFENSTLFNTKALNLAIGNNVLAWTVYQNGCDNGGALVNVYNKSFLVNAGENQSLDPFVTATSFNAEMPAGATGIWFVLAGSGNVIDRYSPVSDVIEMPTGQNTFRWRVEYNDCVEFDDVNIYVFNFVPYAGTDKTTCADSVKMSAMNQSGNPQYWEVIEGAGTFRNINDPGTWVSEQAPGINTYRWYVNISGAVAYDDVSVFKAYAYAGDDVQGCDNFAELEANELLLNWTGVWEVIGGNGVFSNPSISNPTVNQLNPGQNTFMWTITTDECTISDYVSINDNSVDAMAGSDQFVTYPYSNLDAVLPENSTGEWTEILGGANIQEINNPQTNVSNLTTGENTFRWTVNHLGCLSFDDISIFYNSTDVENLFDIQNINVFPNPSSGEFKIKFDKHQQSVDIEIIDVAGKIVISNSYFDTQEIIMSAKALKQGLYFIKIKIDEKEFIEKMYFSE